MGDNLVTIEGVAIGTLTSFTATDVAYHFARRRMFKHYRNELERTYKMTGRQTYTATITKMWLHPRFRPLPWTKRNPPIEALRWWWVHHLGKTNRSFKRTRLAAIRRLWRIAQNINTPKEA